MSALIYLVNVGVSSVATMQCVRVVYSHHHHCICPIILNNWTHINNESMDEEVYIARPQ